MLAVKQHPLGAQIAAFQHLVARAGRHHADLLADGERALHDADVDHDAEIAVVLAVEDEGAQRRVGVARRGRDVTDHVLQHGGDVDAHLRGDLRRLVAGQADDVLDLLLDPGRVGGGEVDLVDDREDLKVVIHREIGVRQRLGLHALRRVHDQHRALAGGQRAADLIVEVHMARRVDQVQRVGLAVVRRVVQPDGAGLDGDAALALQIHVVKDLILHLPRGDRLAQLDQTVGERRFAVVDVGDDGKIADVVPFDHFFSSSISVRLCSLRASS